MNTPITPVASRLETATVEAKESAGAPTGKIFIIFFIWVLWPVKIILLILSRIKCKVGRKWEIPEKNHLTTRKQNLACLTYDPS